MIGLVPVLASTLGKIFQPLFQALAWLLAFFYALVPNYAIAIGLLTVVVMIVTAPLTVKSTRSMMAMQRLSPELKKLQQKYKGDRQKLNEEMMSLYKEHGVNPAGGCLPMLIQFPVFIILYDVIKGLINTVKVHGVVKAAPRYIGHNTRLYKDLIRSPGKMEAFGINLAQRFLGEIHYGIVSALPFAILILIAIALQYLQMRQLNRRNQAFAQANPQAQMMQRYMPLIFAVIYINISAGVNVYFIVSSLCRMGLQLAAFRAGPAGASQKPGEHKVAGGGAPKRRTFMERLADAQSQALEAQKARQTALQADGDSGTGNGKARPGGAQRPAGQGGQGPGRSPRSPSGGSNGGSQPSSRARDKRTRKAR